MSPSPSIVAYTKTLTDGLASQVQFGNVERTTIDNLRNLTDIGAHEHTARTGPDEFRVFKVRARIEPLDTPPPPRAQTGSPWPPADGHRDPPSRRVPLHPS